MVREIKFRAWSVNEEMMWDWEWIQDVPQRAFWTASDLRIMQYTGFKDAGGDELYDGDIFEDDAEWFRIGWDDDEGAWYALAINGGVHMQLSEFAGSSTCWKQGNIYQNPELIEREEDKA